MGEEDSPEISFRPGRRRRRPSLFDDNEFDGPPFVRNDRIHNSPPITNKKTVKATLKMLELLRVLSYAERFVRSDGDEIEGVLFVRDSTTSSGYNKYPVRMGVLLRIEGLDSEQMRKLRVNSFLNSLNKYPEEFRGLEEYLYDKDLSHHVHFGLSLSNSLLYNKYDDSMCETWYSLYSIFTANHHFVRHPQSFIEQERKIDFFTRSIPLHDQTAIERTLAMFWAYYRTISYARRMKTNTFAAKFQTQFNGELVSIQRHIANVEARLKEAATKKPEIPEEPEKPKEPDEEWEIRRLV